MFEKDEHVSFANCGLPYYIGQEIADREKLLVATAELFRRRFAIDVRTRHEVVGIDRAAKAVQVVNRETGERLTEPYDRLILATGASPIVPPLEANCENVFTLRNLDDTDRIKAAVDARAGQHAVVVGAGFIGLEMAEQLQRRGVHTTVVELADQVLPPLDGEMAALIEAELRDHRIELHLGDGISDLQAEGRRATGVVLNSGTVVAADLVILGIGVRPNLELARVAELEIGPGGGIAVSQHMQTSDPSIYAVGDAVEYPHALLESPTRIPLAGPANRAGRIAGEHAATDHALPMTPVAGTAIVRVFGLAAGMTGLSQKLAARLERPVRSVIIEAAHHAGYFPGAKNIVLKLLYEPETGKLLGAQAAGAEGIDKRIDVIATAIHFGGTVHDLAGVDLCYAPPFGAAKDPIHMAAFAAQNDLRGAPPMTQLDEQLAGRQVLDVRSKREVEALPLAGAIHIPLDELRARLDELDRDQPVVAVCHTGKRAHVAARILSQHGFHDVTNLTGGVSSRQRVKPKDFVR